LTKSRRPGLSRREREIMAIVYRRQRATAGEILENLQGEPHLSTVRTQLRMLEAKGYLKHKEDGPRYVYVAAVAQSQVRQSALKQLMANFFDGSATEVISTLFDISADNISDEELTALQRKIVDRRKGRR
jgi:BlaI family transcriptional regulator, penicillinase repressor